jgi:hypothetical protein
MQDIQVNSKTVRANNIGLIWSIRHGLEFAGGGHSP